MNALLKAVIKEASDLFTLGEDVVEKKGLFEIFPAVVVAFQDASIIPALVPDLRHELQTLLVDPAADADLLAYATSLVKDDKAKAIIQASAKLVLDLVNDTSALLNAFKK